MTRPVMVRDRGVRGVASTGDLDEGGAGVCAGVAVAGAAGLSCAVGLADCALTVNVSNITVDKRVNESLFILRLIGFDSDSVVI